MWALPGDDVTLRVLRTPDVGSTDKLSVVRQRSDGVEQAVVPHRDTCTKTIPSSHNGTDSAGFARRSAAAIQYWLYPMQTFTIPIRINSAHCLMRDWSTPEIHCLVGPNMTYICRVVGA